jgi:type IV pilus assembly protein PilQ
VRWTSALDVALKSCGLGQDEENEIIRVAPVAKLAAEHAAQRKLDEERSLGGPLQMRAYRLSYARAAEMAPIIKKFLSPRGEVIYDSRTNTLIVMDVR